MSSKPSTPRLNEADFSAIEAAVMETARGRWFLAEYARRNRAADTESILEAIARLEEMATRLEPHSSDFAELRPILDDIKRLRNTPWQGISDGDGRPLHERPSQAWRSANTALRSTAEKIGEVAYELRETGKLEIYANALELYCADLVGAASLQEAASHRLVELAALLNKLEAIEPESGEANADTGVEPPGEQHPSIAPSDPPALSGRSRSDRDRTPQVAERKPEPAGATKTSSPGFVKTD